MIITLPSPPTDPPPPRDTADASPLSRRVPESEIHERWNAYFEGPTKVFKTHFGYEHQIDVDHAESFITSWRAAEILNGQTSITPTFDLDHLRAIHRHLFGDIYEWAGELRDVTLGKNNQMFTRPDDIEGRFAELVDDMRTAGFLQLPYAERVDALAKVYQEINAIHAFREGNGRSQRLFISELAATMDVDVDFSRMTAGEIRHAAIQAHAGHLEATQTLFAENCRPGAYIWPGRLSARPTTPTELVREVFTFPPSTMSVAERVEQMRNARHPMFDFDPTRLRGPTAGGPHVT